MRYLALVLSVLCALAPVPASAMKERLLSGQGTAEPGDTLLGACRARYERGWLDEAGYRQWEADIKSSYPGKWDSEVPPFAANMIASGGSEATIARCAMMAHDDEVGTLAIDLAGQTVMPGFKANFLYAFSLERLIEPAYADGYAKGLQEGAVKVREELGRELRAANEKLAAAEAGLAAATARAADLANRAASLTASNTSLTTENGTLKNAAESAAAAQAAAEQTAAGLRAQLQHALPRSAAWIAALAALAVIALLAWLARFLSNRRRARETEELVSHYEGELDRGTNERAGGLLGAEKNARADAERRVAELSRQIEELRAVAEKNSALEAQVRELQSEKELLEERIRRIGEVVATAAPSETVVIDFSRVPGLERDSSLPPLTATVVGYTPANDHSRRSGRQVPLVFFEGLRRARPYDHRLWSTFRSDPQLRELHGITVVNGPHAAATAA